MKDENRGVIVILRESGALLDISAEVHSAQSGIDPDLRRVGLRAQPVAVEARVVQKVVSTRLISLCLFLRL